jgi:hypothetical protein
MKRNKKEQKATQKDEIKILYHKPNREVLIQDVLAVRRNTGYVPNYEIKAKVKTTCERPVQFVGGFEEWFHFMRAEHKRDEEQRIQKKLQQENLKVLIEVCYTPHVMNKMLKVE